MSDISGLQNSTFGTLNGFGLIIINNPALAVCNLPNFCAYLANPSNTHPRIISGNLAECVNEAAVELACNPMAVDTFDGAAFTAYPNPVTTTLNLSSANVTIVNMLGQTVLSAQVSATTAQLDVTALPVGNYIVKATTAKAVSAIKIVKQ